MQRRKRRFAGGSLRLDTVKLKFSLDDESQRPVGVSPYIQMPSNNLVEEWMLAANEAVAVHLASHLPRTAFLRRHPPPSLKQLKDASTILDSVGIKINTESAGSIQVSETLHSLFTFGRFYSITLASSDRSLSRLWSFPLGLPKLMPTKSFTRLIMTDDGVVIFPP